MEKKVPRPSLEKIIDKFWTRRRSDGVKRSLIDFAFSVERSEKFPDGFIHTFASTYRNALVDRADVSVLESLINIINDDGQIRALKLLITSLKQSKLADASQKSLLKELVATDVSASLTESQLTLLQGIIDSKSAAADVTLEDNDTLASLVLKKMTNTYAKVKGYEEHMDRNSLKRLFKEEVIPAVPNNTRMRVNDQVSAQRATARSIATTKNLMNRYKNCGGGF